MAASSLRAGLIALFAGALTLAAFALHHSSRDAPAIADLFPAGHLRLGVEADLPPLASMQDGELQGLAVDLGEALAGEMGLTPQFVTVGHDARFDALRGGQIDVLVVAVARRIALEPQVIATSAWFDAGLVLVTPASGPLDSMAQLAGRSLALALGSAADAEARRQERRIAPFETLAYELPQHALDALRFGVADAALVDALDARLYLRDHAWSGSLSQVSERHLAMALADEPPGRWQVVERALQSLLERGEVARLLDRRL